jgi:predicted transcriptional regulator of viral defense system
MKLADLLNAIADEPVFDTGLLLTHGVARADVEKQLSRWSRSGKLHQFRRGLYGLAPPYQKTAPHPFLVANRFRLPSYVSLQSALEYHGLIPEATAVITSVTTGRPGRVQTPLGGLIYRNVKKGLFFGFERMDLGGSQAAFVARPEKALLDLIYLTPHGDDEAWLRQLRLQNLNLLDKAELERMARASGSVKLERALHDLRPLLHEEEGYETL